MIPDFKSVYSKLSSDCTLAEKKLPSHNAIREILRDIRELLFFNKKLDLSDLYERLKREIALAADASSALIDSEKEAEFIINELPRLKCLLTKDVRAIYEGDPAAVSEDEVILSYPGFFAITIYRIANVFYMRKIPLIARMMTEYAHEKTGIDIHAGATIGEYFFIDHGTGIVIGETTTIGDHVKLYQGVTLGAKSFQLDEDGNPIKGVKRHPDIGNNVIIYANATILGGNTKIGDGAVIGANVWLTSSVEPGKVIYYNR